MNFGSNIKKVLQRKKVTQAPSKAPSSPLAGNDRFMNVLNAAAGRPAVESTAAFNSDIFAGMNPLFEGGPHRARFDGIRGVDGLLKDKFQLDYDDSALKKLRSQTLSDMDSPLLIQQKKVKSLMDENALQAARKGDAGVYSAAMGGGNAEANIMRGLNPNVNASLANAQGGVDLATQAREKQLATMRALPGMENAALSAKEFNISNALKEKTNEDQARFQQWNEDMKLWAGKNSAGAVKKSGGGKK